MRKIILHNHLFKNAGTSVDHILRQNFKGRWVTREFSDEECSKSDSIAAWITGNPEAVAFSTHTMQAPLPRLETVQIIPIVLLRDPVDRIASAYRFERTQEADTRGARLARENGFAGYVHARLSIDGDRQCRNFQTSRLAALVPSAPGTELDRACAAARLVAQSGVLGLVSDFDAAMMKLESVVRPFFPSFRWQPVTRNASGVAPSGAVSPDMRKLLEDINQDDFKLLAHAQRLIGQMTAARVTFQQSGIV